MTVKVDVYCFHYPRDSWRREEIPVILPNLQVLCIHTVLGWETVRRRGDKELPDVISDLGLVNDRVTAHLRWSRQRYVAWEEPFSDELSGSGVAQSLHLEVQTGERRGSLQPLVITRLEWPSLPVISCVVDNLYEFGHDPHQTRESAIRETLGLGEVEIAASASASPRSSFTTTKRCEDLDQFAIVQRDLTRALCDQTLFPPGHRQCARGRHCCSWCSRPWVSSFLATTSHRQRPS